MQTAFQKGYQSGQGEAAEQKSPRYQRFDDGYVESTETGFLKIPKEDIQKTQFAVGYVAGYYDN